MRPFVLALLCSLSLIACNRSSGSITNAPDLGPFIEDPGQSCPGCDKVSVTPQDVPPPVECGSISQPCCSNGDGLVCNEGLSCVGGEVCQVVDPDLGTPACGGYGQACCMGDICGDGLACNQAGLCDLVVTPPDGGDPVPPDLGEECVDRHENHKGLGHLKCKGLGHCK